MTNWTNLCYHCSVKTRTGTQKRQFFTVLAVWLIAYGLMLAYLWQNWERVTQWLILSGLTLAYCLHILWRNIHLNPKSTLGWGNALTLYRGLAISLIAGFMFGPMRFVGLAWVIVGLYTSADIADFFDGYVARRTNHVTPLGEKLDMEYDSLGLVVASVLAVSFGQLAWWILILGFARYFFLSGMWLRKRQNKPLYPMTDSNYRRIWAGFFMGWMSATLWPILPKDGLTVCGLVFAGLPALGFMRDWLVVSGRLKPSSATYQQNRLKLRQFTIQTLPFVLRCVLLITAGVTLLSLGNLPQPRIWVRLFEGYGFGAMTGGVVGVLGISAVISLATTFLGILPRLSSFILVFGIGFSVVAQGLSITNAIALICICYIMTMGGGMAAWWPADEKYFARRLG